MKGGPDAQPDTINAAKMAGIAYVLPFILSSFWLFRVIGPRLAPILPRIHTFSNAGVDVKCSDRATSAMPARRFSKHWTARCRSVDALRASIRLACNRVH